MEIINRLYRTLIGQDVGERTQTMLSGLNWVLPATLISRVLTGLTTIGVGRWQGAAIYGDANVSIALTSWIQLPMMLGILTALMHYLPQTQKLDQPAWISTCIFLSLFFCGMTVIVSLEFKSFWARFAHVNPTAIGPAVLWCIGFLLYSLSTSIFIGLERFQWRAYSEIAFSSLYPISVLVFHYSHHLDAAHYVASLALAYAAAGLIGVVNILRRQTLFVFRMTYAKSLCSYGLWSVPGSLVLALLNSPARLIAARLLNSHNVGILSAYQQGSVQMALFLLTPLSQVFFPIASRTPNPVTLLNKITRFLVTSSPFLFLFNMVLIWLTFKLLGKDYEFMWSGILIFSLAAVTTFCHGLLAWFMTSQGVRPMVWGSISGIVAGIVNIVLCIVLIKRWQVFGAGVAMAIAPIVGIIGCYLMAPKAMREIKA
jgi:O-antigen/teichoic acid export membrane protein